MLDQGLEGRYPKGRTVSFCQARGFSVAGTESDGTIRMVLSADETRDWLEREGEGSLPPAGTGWPDNVARADGAPPAPGDELDAEITALKTLHPNLQLEYRQSDLRSMSRQTKLLLLQDIREALGIKPLRRTTL